MGKGNMGTCKVKSVAPSVGRIVFSKPDGGDLNVRVTNSSVAYPADRLQGFGEMILVAQSAGMLGKSGTILIAQLEAM